MHEPEPTAGAGASLCDPIHVISTSDWCVSAATTHMSKYSACDLQHAATSYIDTEHPPLKLLVRFDDSLYTNHCYSTRKGAVAIQILTILAKICRKVVPNC